MTAIAAGTVLVLAVGACSDKQPSEPTASAPEAAQSAGRTMNLASCPANAQQQIDNLLPQLFTSGSQRGTASSLNAAMKKALREGRQADAEQLGSQLIQFTLDNYNANQLIGGQSATTTALVKNFIELIYCVLGKGPTNIVIGPGTGLITPVTTDTIVRSSDGLAGARFPQGTIPNFPGVVVSIYPTTDTLNTNLDKYQPNYEFSVQPYTAFNQDVLTGVCFAGPPPNVDLTDLRLAHNVPANYVANPSTNQRIDGIEILAPKDISPLGLDGGACVSYTYSPGLEGFFRRMFEIVGPQPLYARGTGGVGGTVRTFSPFGTVDRKLKVAKNAASTSGVQGQTVATPPSITITTRKGVARPGLKVTLATAPSGSSITPDTATSGTDGKAAAASWTLALGSNTATFTPIQGVASQSQLTFDSTTVSFVATGVAGVAITTTSPLPKGQVGTAYSQTFAVSGGSGPYTWGVKTGSTLPAGLSLNSGTGALTGTPTAFGTFNFTITVSGTVGGSAEKAFAVTIDPPPVEIVDPATPVDGKTPLPAATAGVSYSQQLSATGGDGTYAFALANSTTLPAGLSLSGTGLISGQPTVFGTFTFDITVTSGGQSNTKTFSLVINPPAVVVTTTTLPTGTVNSAYSASLAASGGTGSYTWSITTGSLPGGLGLSGNSITGTPTTAGTFTFTVKAESPNATPGTKSLSITIDPPPVSITTSATLPAGQKTVAYSQQLAASGGTGTYSWAVTGGALPGGLTLSSSGLVSGTPTAAGSFSFTARASSGTATPDSRTFSLSIGLAPITSLTLAFVVQPSSATCNGIIPGPVTVSVRDQNGDPRAGVTVNIEAVDNNGNTVAVNGTPAVSGTNGNAVFSALSINKTGSYRLIASVTSPTASVRSQKFNVAPPCQ